MLKIERDIKSLYALNLVEGEGLGTAYEYFVKLRKLKRFINSIQKPKRILIAGLPERYGLSMDFFLLGQILQAETVVVDERSEVLEKAQKVLRTLRAQKIFDERNVTCLKVEEMAEFNKEKPSPGLFDLALSSEVLQRLDKAQGTYISNLKKVSKNFALFVPNQGNESHARISELKGVYLRDMLRYCYEGDLRIHIFDHGYLDMPPFPPGLKRSQQKRERAATSRLTTLMMKGLETYSLCEDLIPKFLKKKKAHIVYAMIIS